jgi:ubiquinone/menaquinone biosynthesis C-methylase UbiE
VAEERAFKGPSYYNDCLGPPLLEPLAADLAQRMPKNPPGDVLEIACGTGLVTKRLRERLSPSVRLVATDLSREMLDFARARIGAAPRIEWREADAMHLPYEDARFAAVVCGFGFMLMPDRQAALVEARRVLQAGGILLFNVWDRIEENPHALAASRVLEALFPDEPEVGYRYPYEMSDRELLRRLLAGAGFAQARFAVKRIRVAGADPRSIATGQIRGTPRAATIEKRGVSPDTVIDQIAEALTIAGGNPYRGPAKAVVVSAVAVRMDI